jgi:hypothetical protein
MVPLASSMTEEANMTNRSTTPSREESAMLDAREEWWNKLAERGDPNAQGNKFDAFAAGYFAALRKVKELING